MSERMHAAGFRYSNHFASCWRPKQKWTSLRSRHVKSPQILGAYWDCRYQDDRSQDGTPTWRPTQEHLWECPDSLVNIWNINVLTPTLFRIVWMYRWYQPHPPNLIGIHFLCDLLGGFLSAAEAWWDQKESDWSRQRLRKANLCLSWLFCLDIVLSLDVLLLLSNHQLLLFNPLPLIAVKTYHFSMNRSKIQGVASSSRWFKITNDRCEAQQRQARTDAREKRVLDGVAKARETWEFSELCVF